MVAKDHRIKELLGRPRRPCAEAVEREINDGR